MADARGAWNETGEKLTELGRKLKLHYEEQHGEGQPTRQELADAARKVGSAVQDAFEAFGAAARDKTVQSDARAVGHSLAEALGATLGTASEELRRALSERKGDIRHSTPASSPPSPPAPSTSPTASSAGDPMATEPPTPDAGPDGPDGQQPPKVEPWGTP
jgi:hypothetical protein